MLVADQRVSVPMVFSTANRAPPSARRRWNARS
jgi:hypothetical protein